MKKAILLIIALVSCWTSIRAQYCNPATVSYLVRDEKGNILNQADLKSVTDQLPQQVGDGNTSIYDVSFADDKKMYFWQDSSKFDAGHKVPAILFANSATCTMHLTDAMLQYRGQKMHLIFEIKIGRDQPDRRLVIDSLPFAKGTFKLDLSQWDHATDKLIPATYWKKVESTP